MAANKYPIFTLNPNAVPAQISVANTNRDGSGTLGTILTAGPNGTRLEALKAVAITGTASADVIRYYITDQAGANPRLFEERLISAITPSTTTKIAEDFWTLDKPLILASGTIIKAAPNNAVTYNIFPHAGDY